MPIYIVSCGLNNIRKDYRPLWEAMATAGAKRAMETIWLLDTRESIETITAAVLAHLASDDRLFVAEVGCWSATRLIDDAGPWLLARRPPEAMSKPERQRDAAQCRPGR